MKPHNRPLSNPATEVYTTGLNETPSESGNTVEGVRRNWWWRLRASLGLLPAKESTDRDLRQAIRAEEHDEVMRLLDAGVTPDKYPNTPWVCLTARRESRTLTELILVHGADVDAGDRETRGAIGRTALHEAAKRGWSKGVRLLLDANASHGVVDDEGCTPLHLAVKKGHTDTVRMLLEAGADPLAADFRGRQPLHDAVNAETALVLMQAGASVEAADKKGNRPLHSQVKSGRPEVVQALLANEANPAGRDKKGRTPLFWLGRGDAVGVLKVLEKDAQWDLPDDEGNVPAHAIAFRSDTEELISAVYLRTPQTWGIGNHQGDTPLLILQAKGRMALADKIQADLALR